MAIKLPESFGLFGLGLGSIFTIWLVNVFVKGYRARRICAVLKKEGIPMPKHNMFLGHLLAMKPYVDGLPSDAHPVYYFGGMAKRFSGGVYYLDMWPFLIVCTSLNATIDATQRTATASSKPDFLYRWFETIAGGPNLFTMEETEWKPRRTIFNPGFSQVHIFKLVPAIVHEALLQEAVV